eukprot:evm.model.scf_617.2 EVM.evm.TU.scf_617.2   scf_617:15672-16955(-)
MPPAFVIHQMSLTNMMICIEVCLGGPVLVVDSEDNVALDLTVALVVSSNASGLPGHHVALKISHIHDWIRKNMQHEAVGGPLHTLEVYTCLLIAAACLFRVLRQLHQQHRGSPNVSTL